MTGRDDNCCIIRTCDTAAEQRAGPTGSIHYERSYSVSMRSLNSIIFPLFGDRGLWNFRSKCLAPSRSWSRSILSTLNK